MDEELNQQLIINLVNLVNESVAESDRIAEALINMKRAGYDVFLILDATIQLKKREETPTIEAPEPFPSVFNTSGRINLTTDDTNFMKEMNITPDVDTGKGD